MLLARCGDRPAGFALARAVVDEAELLLLAVRPEHRRVGIGSALLDAVTVAARARGAVRLHLEMRENNPAADWQQYFGENSEPVADAKAYPPFSEVREKYRQLREQNLKILDSLSDADLDKSTKAPPKGREKEFATYGQSFLVLALHQTMHRGNVTDARRAAGSLAVAMPAAS